MAYRQLLIFGVIICSLKSVTAETCTYTRTPDTKPTGDGDFGAGINTIDDCEAACTVDSMCAATQFKNSVCFTSTQTSTESDSGSTHSLKSCVADTTVPDTTTLSQGTCSMVQQANTKGGTDFLGVFEFSASSCGDLCRVLDNCHSVSYDNTQCKIYTESTTTSAATGKTVAVKTTCASGKNCCFSTKTDTAGGTDHAVLLTKSLASCEDLCMKYRTCTSVYWDGTQCHIYTQTTETTSETNSIYSVKTCTGDSTAGMYSFTDVCSGSGMTSIGKLALVAFSLFITIFTVYL